MNGKGIVFPGFVVGLLLSVSTGALWVSQAMAQEAAPEGAIGPKYRCEEPIYKFTGIWSGDPVEHTFIIHNDGDAPLEILEVKPSCGCTVAKEYDSTIAPGQFGRIPVTLKTTNYKNRITKTISVKTNDPANSNSRLTLQGNIKSRIDMEPRYGANWGRITNASELTQKVKIINNMTPPLSLELVPGRDLGIFTVEIEQLEAGKTAQLVFTAHKPFKEGSNNQSVRFNTGIPEYPNLEVRCNLFAPSLVEVIPRYLSLLTPLTRNFQRIVQVRYNGEGTLELAPPKVNDASVAIRMQVKTPGKNFTLTVNIPKEFAPQEDVPLEIELVTNVEEKPKITIPIKIRNRSKYRR